MNVAFLRLQADVPAPEREASPEAVPGDAAAAFAQLLAPLLHPGTPSPAVQAEVPPEPEVPAVDCAGTGAQMVQTAPPHSDLRAAFAPVPTAFSAEEGDSSGEAPAAEPAAPAEQHVPPAAEVPEADSHQQAEIVSAGRAGAAEHPPATGPGTAPQPTMEAADPAPATALPDARTVAVPHAETVQAMEPADERRRAGTGPAPRPAAEDAPQEPQVVTDEQAAQTAEPVQPEQEARVAARAPVPVAPEAAGTEAGRDHAPIGAAPVDAGTTASATVAGRRSANAESGAGGQTPERPASPQAPEGEAPAQPAATIASGGSGTNVRPAGKDVRAEREEAAPREEPEPASDAAVAEPPAPQPAGSSEASLTAGAEVAAPQPPGAPPADVPAAPGRPETPRAPVSVPVMERWQADLQNLAAELRTEAGGWQRLRLRLDDESGTVTLRARREDDRVAVTVAFSDPVLRQAAHASAERLHAALETQFGQQVAFSFEGGGAQQHASTGDRPSASPTPSSPSASEPERSAPLLRRAATAGREWFG